VLGSPVAVSGELDDLGRVVSVLAERLLGGEADDAPGGPLAGLGPAALDWARGLGGEDREVRRASLERAVVAAPHHDGPRLALGVLLREQGEPAAAAAALAQVRDPLRTRRAALLRALALLEAGEHEAARELFASLARIRETPAVLNGLAVALLRQEIGPVPEPIFAALERAAKLAPESPVLAFNRAWAELRAGRADQAAARLGELIAREPRDALARLVRVWCLGVAGQGRARDAEWEVLWSWRRGWEPSPSPTRHGRSRG
jgi:tetratricopeptide (TPR) repeat protein